MAIVQCPNNHYYDDKRDATCPYCEKLNNAFIPEDGINEQLTSYMNIEQHSDEQVTEAYGEYVQEFEKTIGIFTDESQNQLTAGWLVCIEGTEKGKSYVIRPGRNFAGRSLDMDIVLSDDTGIAREKHFFIIYDPKSVSFYLVCGKGHTYVNDEAVTSEILLTDGDIIKVGKSKYIFVPFCKEGRDWT